MLFVEHIKSKYGINHFKNIFKMIKEKNELIKFKRMHPEYIKEIKSVAIKNIKGELYGFDIAKIMNLKDRDEMWKMKTWDFHEYVNSINYSDIDTVEKIAVQYAEKIKRITGRKVPVYNNPFAISTFAKSIRF